MTAHTVLEVGAVSLAVHFLRSLAEHFFLGRVEHLIAHAVGRLLRRWNVVGSVSRIIRRRFA